MRDFRRDAVLTVKPGHLSSIPEAMSSLPVAAPPRAGFQLLLLSVVVLASNYARTAVGPLQEAIRISLLLSDNQIAVLQGPALAFPVLAAAIPLGFLVDRYSRVRLLLAFAVSNLIGSVFTAMSSGFIELLIARSLVGLTATATFTTALSLIADYCAPNQRGRATMLVAVSQIVGTSAAFALGGALLAMPGGSPSGWRWVMWWMASPLATAVVLSLAMREPPRRGQTVRNPSVSQAYSELWDYRKIFLSLLSGMVMMEMALGAVLVWAAPMLSRRFSLSPDRIGTIMATGLVVSGVLGPIVGGTLADICERSGGSRKTMMALSGLALLTVPMSLFAWAPGIAATIALLGLFTLIVSATTVMGTTLFTVAIPNELRGLCTAIMTAACILFAAGLAPLAVTLLSAAVGGPSQIGTALSLVGIVTGFLGAASFTLGRQHVPLPLDKRKVT
jgi:MFS family permease